MYDTWTVVSGNGMPESDEDLKRAFGDEIIVSRMGRFNLIHMDNPSRAEVARREREFNPEDLLEDDCPLCQMLRAQGGNILYEAPE